MARSRGFTAHRTVNRFIALLGSLLIVSGVLLGAITPAALASSSGTSGPSAPTASPAPTGWTNPDSAWADGGGVATAGPGDDEQGYDNFAISMPPGSIIDGIEVKVDAFASDATGCELEVRLSQTNNGNNVGNVITRDLTGAETTLTFGGPTNTFGAVWDPTQFETSPSPLRVLVRFDDPGAGCDNAATASIDFVTLKAYFRTIDDSVVKQPALPGDLCEAADFNFVIDMSGSIGQQGSTPPNLPELKSGIIGFVNAFQLQGDGRYSGTRFNGTTASNLTSGFVVAGNTTTAGTFINAVNGLSGPTGTTPTSAGIDNGVANDGPPNAPRAGVPKIMFIVTDGSPNVPGGDLADPPTWLQAADAAIGAADDARAAGYRVYAVYVRTDGDPGDTTLPFSNPAGDTEWASTVMDKIGHGLVIDADFATLADDLLEEFGCKPEVTISKAADAASVSAGEQIGFTITVHNAQGADPATGVVVTDSLPNGAGLNWSIASSDPTCSMTDDTPPNEAFSCNFGTLNSNQSKSIHVVSGTTAASCGVYNNTAAFTTTNDGQGPSNQASVTVNCPDIEVVKTADQGPFSAGDQIGFSVTIKNNGPGTATGAQASDTLPGSGWSIQGNANGWLLNGNTLSYGPATLGTGPGATVHVVKTTTVADCHLIENTATAWATNDPGATQQLPVSDSASLTVNCPDIEVVKTADQGPFSAGDQIGFSVTIKNNGPGTATGAQASDTLPGSGWSIQGNANGWLLNGNTLSYGPATLGTGPGATVHVVKTTTVADCHLIENTATAWATNDPGATQQLPVSDSASLTVNCPDIVVEKQADDLSVSAGDEVGFTVTIRNIGLGTAHNVTASDTLLGTGWGPQGSADGWTLSGSSLTFSAETLGAGQSRSYHVTKTSTSDDCGTIPNTVSGFAANEPPNLQPNTADASVQVRCPDLRVEKTGNGPLSADQTATFSITITNFGPGTAYDVTVNDTLPAGPAWGVDSVDPAITACDVTANVLDCDPFDLGPGDSVEITISGETSITADCPDLVNEVTVGASNEHPEDVGDENSDEATIVVNCPNLGITKTALHEDPVLAGEDIGFRIDVVNSGEGNAFNVFVSDPLPAGFSWTITSSSGGWAIVGNLLTWGPDTVAPEDADATREGPWAIVEAGTDLADCGEVPNTAHLFQGITIIGIPLPPDTEIGTGSATEEVRCPDIGIDKQVEEGGQNPEVGQEVEFTINVTVSEGPVTNAIVTDVLPAGQTYLADSQTSSLPATFQEAGQTLTWTFPTLNDGDPAVTITYKVTIDEGSGGQELINTAELCVDEIELCEEDLAIVNTGSRFDVTIEKSNNAPASGTLALPTVVNGDTITYTLDYTVFVEGLETDVFVVDVLPEGVTYVPGSATTDAQFTNVQFFPDPSDPLTDANDDSGALVWTGSPAVSGNGTLTYKATADKDDPTTEDVDEGGAGQAQPLVNNVEICLGDVDSETGEPGDQPILCDEAASQVFVNELPLALTPPPTDTIEDLAPAASGPNLPLILILLGALMLFVSVLAPTPAANRVRRDR